MNRSVDLVGQGVDDMSSEIGIGEAEGTQEITNSYESFGYKDNRIEVAKEDVKNADYEAVEESLQQAEEEILGTLSEEYGVDEETLRSLLEDMGLNVLDLLNPQNLVSFVMALTGINTGEELLLEENFLKVMETLDTLSNNLMKEFSVDEDGLQKIISMMETVNLEGGEVSFEQMLESQTEGAMQQDVTQTDANAQMEVTQTDVTEEMTQQNVEDSTVTTEQADAETAEEGLKVQMEKTTESTETSESKVLNSEVEEVSTGTKDNGDSSLFDNQNRGNDFTWNQETSSNQVFVTSQPISVGQFTEMPQMQLNSYLGVDTLQIMEQIAEQIRVVVTPDTTSMEMQINPENLGKIYLHISSEEGVVSAQFAATNEVVKEALELQMATLRENLTQAGVKVDAIEVTIASHEFEKNLEQNQKNPDEQLQEEKTTKRRNLSVDSLDELQGVMTEEETLVAQIMKDNGNSIDFTA
jgi:flagellar hook-length control protein FliK